MIKKTITYENWDGETVSEEFYFGLTEAEIIEIEASGGGRGLSDLVNVAIKNDNPKIVVEAFKSIIQMSVGRREGQRFVKSDSVKADFMETGAYSALFVEMLTDPAAAALFVNGVMPKAAQDKPEVQKAVQDIVNRPLPGNDVPDVVIEDAFVPETQPTFPSMQKEQPDFSSMSKEQLEQYVRDNPPGA